MAAPTVSVELLETMGAVIARFYGLEYDVDMKVMRSEEFSKVSEDFGSKDWYNSGKTILADVADVTGIKSEALRPQGSLKLHVPISALYHALVTMGLKNHAPIAVASALMPARAPAVSVVPPVASSSFGAAASTEPATALVPMVSKRAELPLVVMASDLLSSKPAWGPLDGTCLCFRLTH